MASRPRPFTEAEKVALLAEVIKTSVRSDSAFTALRRVINDQPALDPQWYDMSLPHGRTPRECHEVLQELYLLNVPPLTGPPVSGDRMTTQRPYFPGETGSSTGRAILPRTAPGQPMPQFFHQNILPGIPSSTLSSPSYELPPRKRGRPSNEQREHERQVAEARGEPWPPPKRPRRQRGPARPSLAPQDTVAGSVESASEPQSATTPTAPVEPRTTSHPTSPTTANPTRESTTGPSPTRPPTLPSISRPLPGSVDPVAIPPVTSEPPRESQRGPTLAPYRGVGEPSPQESPYLSPYRRSTSPRTGQPHVPQTTAER